MKYGLTLEEYEQMADEQDGKCYLCGTSEPGGWVKCDMRIDHCHRSGKVRKLLCNRCNLVLGLCDDDIELFRAMADYVEVFSG
ncbi:endonuclease VII domain-containing protein [Micromonospora sp. CB01531]|uniref:endonuclease VII domain-containing protein n=1 Tax=Micromonospora sp. CB01531 TaxID=1718947 RepID=UPI000938C012